MTLKEENKVLRGEVKALHNKVNDLLKIIEQLGHKKNSRNSSLAPSIDINRKNKSLRGRSTKKSGGQKGHKGSTLPQSDEPDKVTDLKSSFCNLCGNSLSEISHTLLSKRQVADIPPIDVFYHEYRQYRCSCPHCNNKQTADYPSNVTAPIQYGARVQSLVSYLSVSQYIPYARLSELFSQIFNTPISEGSICNILNNASSKARGVYNKIKETLSKSEVIGSDETGAKVNGKKSWVWVWQDFLNTYIVCSENRGYVTIDTEWKNGFPASALVSDRLPAQLKTPALVHQVCLAHLLREATYIEEVEAHQFVKIFKDFLIDIFDFKKKQTQNFTTDSIVTRAFEDKLNSLLSIPILKDTHPKTVAFQKAMMKCRNYILPCIYKINIPPDNNGSERAVRNIKVKQKISGQFKTGQKAFCILRSVIDTLKKRGCEILPFLYEIMQLDAKAELQPE